MAIMDRRTFVQRSAVAAGGVAAMGPLGALSARAAHGAPPSAEGYGPLVPKGDLALPAAFNYQVLDRQGGVQRDGNITPGIFDAMGAFPDSGANNGGRGGRTILIRNHENRERPGEIKVTTGPAFEYDETAFGGCTKLVVSRERIGKDPTTGQDLYQYTVQDKFNILGGTSTNCAGGELPFKKWMTCEEVVKRTGTGENSLKHGYNFEIDAMADGPVVAVPIPQMGRFVHEATTWRSGILYETEDRRLSPTRR